MRWGLLGFAGVDGIFGALTNVSKTQDNAASRSRSHPQSKEGTRQEMADPSWTKQQEL